NLTLLGSNRLNILLFALVCGTIDCNILLIADSCLPNYTTSCSTPQLVEKSHITWI
uniref:Uncharacterized protein n=1 Tax=Triticum urartu TaxID=4572 RepID=A0A8R7UE70_TRIUA